MLYSLSWHSILLAISCTAAIDSDSIEDLTPCVMLMKQKPEVSCNQIFILIAGTVVDDLFKVSLKLSVVTRHSDV